MSVLKKHKPKLKCECGRPAAPGSVFCTQCRAAISRRNARTTLKEEKRYQREMRGTWRKKK